MVKCKTTSKGDAGLLLMKAELLRNLVGTMFNFGSHPAPPGVFTELELSLTDSKERLNGSRG